MGLVNSIPGVAIAKGFDLVGNKLSVFPGMVSSRLIWHLGAALSERYLAMVKGAIQGHEKAGLNWPQHSKWTTKMYGPHRLLRLTGTYMKSLRRKRVSTKKGQVVYHIGAFPEDIHTIVEPKTGRTKTISMAALGHTLEWGRPDNMVFGKYHGPIPARPHFRPTKAKFEKIIAGQVITEELIKTMKAFWRP